MENFDDNIENEYRSRFEDFEEMPDDLLWNKIQSRIAPEKERPFIIWLRTPVRTIGLAASLLIALGIGTYFMFKTDTQIQGSRLNEKQVNHNQGSVTKTKNAEESKQDVTGQTLKQQNPVAGVLKEMSNKGTDMAKHTSGLMARKRNRKDSALQQINKELPVTLVSEETRTLVLKDVYALTGKGANIFWVNKHLNAPDLYTEAIAIEVEEKHARFFLPPSEMFINVNPTLSYYMFSPNKGDNVLVSDFSNSSQRLGFGAQIGFVYPLARKFDLRTGVSYFTRKSSISYDITDESKKNVVVVDNNSIQINPGSSAMNETRNWHYLELQSDVLYAIKAMQAVSVGFKVGMQTSSMNAPLVQGRLGYRISRPVNNRWALWLEPAVSVSLSSQNSAQNLFMYRTTGFGLNLGVSLLK
ncbi:hypothetical protein [Emticicia sp. 21SJ11W-3]|uniref:hypothetical protein n=1 Tax=Emticicia sp. 21SJ11W-3 TaxID=2916755 RepID=UPI00209DEB76|nr:hypothetical protein [Emticicia sp. 21SJ11W-3]UTA68986.1 hypothetical protein MB380_04070 [Emticicia sp. 21SJ11W-3]